MTAGLLDRVRYLTCTVENLLDENQLWRQKAGVSATDTIDLSGVKLAKVKPSWTFRDSADVACLCIYPEQTSCPQATQGSCLKWHSQGQKTMQKSNMAAPKFTQKNFG